MAKQSDHRTLTIKTLGEIEALGGAIGSYFATTWRYACAPQRLEEGGQALGGWTYLLISVAVCVLLVQAPASPPLDGPDGQLERVADIFARPEGSLPVWVDTIALGTLVWITTRVVLRVEANLRSVDLKSEAIGIAASSCAARAAGAFLLVYGVLAALCNTLTLFGLKNRSEVVFLWACFGSVLVMFLARRELRVVGGAMAWKHMAWAIPLTALAPVLGGHAVNTYWKQLTAQSTPQADYEGRLFLDEGHAELELCKGAQRVPVVLELDLDSTTTLVEALGDHAGAAARLPRAHFVPSLHVKVTARARAGGGPKQVKLHASRLELIAPSADCLD